MSSYISADLRRLVASRAGGACEYCLIHENNTYVGCQVDHIISEKHGGLTEPDNLAYACACCHRAKGSDIGSIASSTGQLTRLFNPRTDRWGDHLALQGLLIQPRTPVGEATVRALALNDSERMRERQALGHIGKYPPRAALERLSQDDM
jgi:hypothetical protein